MGAAESKPGAGSQQVFHAETPVRFSEHLTNSLQDSAATDSTRAKNIELQIQSRVTEELEKLLSQSSQKLSSVTEKVSAEPSKTSPDTRRGQKGSVADPTESSSWTDKPLFTRIGEFFTGSSTPSDSKVPQFQPDLKRSDVQKEIDVLREKLAGRKQLKDIDQEVKRAQEEVTKCLKLNDRRPLDCWQEVENFKTEVGRLEKTFVQNNGY